MEKSATDAELTSRLDFKVVIAIVVTIGIFLRFFHLDFQDYWHDEATTSLNIAAHTKLDAGIYLLQQPRQFGDLLAYCEPARNDFASVWTCWTTEQPAKGPLFYLLEYCWACAFGNSVLVMRLLPALLSLLQLPAFYCFGKESFGSNTAGWIMVALVAISPCTVLFAQDARDYSLYTAMVAFVSAAFLKAVRTPSRINWFLYSFSLTVSLYASVLIPLTVGAQFVFLLVYRKYQLAGRFVISTIAAAFIFSPWLCLNTEGLLHGYRDQKWMSHQLSPSEWIDRFLCVLWTTIFYPGQVFLPFLAGHHKSLGLGAILYSIFRVIRIGTDPCRTFPLFLLVVGSAPFITMDLISGGLRATVTRYMLHAQVAVIGCVAYAFFSCICQGSRTKLIIWYCAFLSFCLVSIDSTTAIAMSRTNFVKCINTKQYLRPIANRINKAREPATVVSSMEGPLTNHVQMFALCRLVKPETKLIFVEKLNRSDIPTDLNEFFLFCPQPSFVELLGHSGYKLEPIPGSIESYTVKRPLIDVSER